MSGSSHPLARRFRIAAVFIVLFGVIGAETLYWAETRTESSPSTNPELLTNEKAAARQAQSLYGNTGAAMDDWIDNFRQSPREQAGLVILTAAALAIGCVGFASWLGKGGHEN